MLNQATALAQDFWRSCGCHIPGGLQGQAGYAFEQTGPVVGIPAHGGSVGDL